LNGQQINITCGLTIPVTFLIVFGMFLFPSISGSEEKRKDTEKTVITAEEIRKMNVRTVVELLNQIPGVSAGDSSVSIHGSHIVRVLLDGRPINDPLSGHRAVRWGSIALENIEEIEIIKGGGAVLFGDDSSGGVIIIKTKKIRGSKGNVEAFAGNLNTRSLSLNWQRDIPLSSDPLDADTSNGAPPMGIGLSAGWYRTDGYRTNDDRDKKRAGAKIAYKPADACDLDLSLDYSQEERGAPGLPEYPTPQAKTGNKTFGSSLLAKMWGLRSGTYFSNFEKEHKNPERTLETFLKSWSVKEDLKSAIPIGRYGSINAGANVEVARVKGNKIESHQEERYGLYASREIPFSRFPVKLGLGLRCNLYSEYDYALNPEVKLAFDRDGFGFQLSALRTNNIPTFLQRYYESSTTTPNPNLGMEKAMNYSLAFSYHPKGAFEGDVSFFFNKVKDRITYVRGDGGIGSYQNLGEVTLKGVEFSMTWKPLRPLEIKPSYVYLSAKDDNTGNWLPCKAEHNARLDLRYRPIDDLAVALNTRYVSGQYTRSDNKESVPGYFLADLKADYYLNKLRLFVKIENILNKDYYYGDGYPAPPRTWNVGLSYEF